MASAKLNRVQREFLKAFLKADKPMEPWQVHLALTGATAHALVRRGLLKAHHFSDGADVGTMLLEMTCPQASRYELTEEGRRIALEL